MKVIIFFDQGIGDLVMIIPTLKALKQHGYNITFIAMDDRVKILDGQGLYDTKLDTRIYIGEVETNNFTDFKKLKLAIKLLFSKKEKYDFGLIDIGVKRPYRIKLMLRLLGCKKFMQCERNYTAVGESSLHKVQQSLQMLDKLDIKYDNIYPILEVSDIDLSAAKKLMTKTEHAQKNIAICIGGLVIKDSDTGIIDYKRWPIERYAELIKRLSDKNDIYLVSGKEERAEFEIYWQQLSQIKNVYNLMGETTLGQSAAVLSLCDFAIGNDTGMMHVAAAVKTPTLSIFGPTEPCFFAPFAENNHYIRIPLDCRPCYVSNFRQMFECRERKCINLITVDMVYEKAEEILNSISIKKQEEK